MADGSSIGETIRPGIVPATRRLAVTGFTNAGQPLWSRTELRALRRFWPDRAKLAKVLPERTLKAIERKAAKLELAVRPKRNHVWTCAQVRQLKRMWPVATREEMLTAFPWARWDDLANKVQDIRRRERLVLARPKIQVSPTGIEIMDQILARVRAANLSLRDLDAGARTGTYFQRGRFRRRLLWMHLAPAAEWLGGELSVTSNAPD